MVANNASHECRAHKVRKQATSDHPYHFVESGMPNVYLSGIDYYVCEICGKQSADIPELCDLLTKIAAAIVRQEPALTGEEIRFLRKRLVKKQSEFARIIGVTPEQASRWETNDNPPSESADKLIRVFYCLLSGDADLKTLANEHIAAWMTMLPGELPVASFQAQMLDDKWTAETVST